MNPTRLVICVLAIGCQQDRDAGRPPPVPMPVAAPAVAPAPPSLLPPPRRAVAPAPGTTCSEVVEHRLDVLVEEVQYEMVEPDAKLAAEYNIRLDRKKLENLCRDDRWSDAARACWAKAMPRDLFSESVRPLDACERLFTAAQKRHREAI